jgi:hypothetical protein
MDSEGPWLGKVYDVMKVRSCCAELLFNCWSVTKFS